MADTPYDPLAMLESYYIPASDPNHPHKRPRYSQADLDSAALLARRDALQEAIKIVAELSPYEYLENDDAIDPGERRGFEMGLLAAATKLRVRLATTPITELVVKGEVTPDVSQWLIGFNKTTEYAEREIDISAFPIAHIRRIVGASDTDDIFGCYNITEEGRKFLLENYAIELADHLDWQVEFYDDDEYGDPFPKKPEPPPMQYGDRMWGMIYPSKEAYDEAMKNRRGFFKGIWNFFFG